MYSSTTKWLFPAFYEAGVQGAVNQNVICHDHSLKKWYYLQNKLFLSEVF